LLLKKGKVAESLAEFQDLVKETPQNPMWRFSLARALIAKGDPDRARAEFLECLKRRPDFIPARLALAVVSRLKHDYLETLRYATEVLAVNPKILQASLLRAAGLVGTQQYAAAHASLAGLEKDNPKNRDVQYQLAALELAEKKHAAAEAR